MGKDKYHPYQTVGDVILGWINPRKGPPLRPQQMKREKPAAAEDEPDEDDPKVKKG
jgi:hypothetical protein